MKTKEQIEKAQDLIIRLKDYIELAKVESKLKNETIKEQTNKMIEDIVSAAMKITYEL